MNGYFISTQEIERRMVEQRSGKVINYSSDAGLFGSVGHSAYGPAKAAVIALTRVAEAELGPSGIQVNAIVPGQVTRVGSGRPRSLGRAIAVSIGPYTSRPPGPARSTPLGIRAPRAENLSGCLRNATTSSSAWTASSTPQHRRTERRVVRCRLRALLRSSRLRLIGCSRSRDIQHCAQHRAQVTDEEHDCQVAADWRVLDHEIDPDELIGRDAGAPQHVWQTGAWTHAADEPPLAILRDNNGMLAHDLDRVDFAHLYRAGEIARGDRGNRDGGVLC